MEQRLRGDIELYGRLGCTRRILPNLYAAEPGSILDETGSGAQLCFTLHVTHNLLTVHLGGTTEAFLQCLSREAFFVDSPDDLMDVKEVADD